MNSIKATAGGVVPVVIINPNLAFACNHVSLPFNKIVCLTKNGLPYPTENKWHRFQLKDGSVAEDAQSNFSVRDVIQVAQNSDGVFFQTYRSFPVEAIEPVAQAKLGDTVIIVSNRTKTEVFAKVTNVAKGAGYFGTDYKAYSGDSGSIVKDVNGVFLGFVSSQIVDGTVVVGSTVVVPETGIVTTPNQTVVAPNPNQPQPGTSTPTLPVTTTPPVVFNPQLPVTNEFEKGIVAGKQALALEIKTTLDALQRKLNSLL